MRSLLAFCVAPLAAAIFASPTRAADLPTRETPVGRLALPVVPDSLVVSPDSSRVAFAAKAGDPTLEEKGVFINPRQTDPRNDSAKAAVNPICLYIDDKSTIPFDGMSRAIFSPDSKHLAYAGRTDKQWRLVVDGKTLVADADDAPGVPIVFSADSAHTAWVVQKDGRTLVTVDNRAWPPLEGGGVGGLSFSPDARHIALVMRVRGAWTIYVDGFALPAPTSASQPATRAARPQLDKFGQLTWRPDCTGIAFYAGFAGTQWQLFYQSLDGTITGSSPYDGILRGSPAFSPDGRQSAYAGVTRNKWEVVSELPLGAAGLRQAEFDQIFAESFAYYVPEGQTNFSLLYLAQQGKVWHLYQNGSPAAEAFDALSQGNFVVSPDKHHFAFAAVQNGHAVVIRDGVPLASHDEVASSTLAFSPDSRHLAYAAHIGGNWFACVDGTAGAPFSALAPTPPAFSPDSSRIAFAGLDAAKAWRVIVGKDAEFRSKPFDAFLKGSHIHWRADGTIVTLAIEKKVAMRVEATPPAK
ncbi:MAG TPA: hypothetical protein VHM90_16765 [Phycisphaerae bacterium]|nr:hypothetical protein [Phycisphaerae bacterium]